MVLDVFHQHRDLRLERRRVPGQRGQFQQEILHLPVLLDTLADNLLELLIPVL